MRQFAALTLVLFLSIAPASAQKIKRMEFHNQPITDILLALAQSAGISIVPDETVNGNASFFFSESEFEDALEWFLSSYKLFGIKTGTAYHVSRIRASFDAETGLANLEADDVDLALLVRAFSKALGVTILYDTLPRATLTINAQGLPPETILRMLVKRFSDWSVERDMGCYCLRKAVNESGTTGKANNHVLVKEGDLYSLSLEKGSFLEILPMLFREAGREYSLLDKTDVLLENLYFSAREFDALLRLVLEQGNADFAIQHGVYYIFEIQRKDVLKKFLSMEVLVPRHLPAQDLVSLLPADLASGSLIRVEKTSNAIILAGSAQEIVSLRSFLMELDRSAEGLTYRRYDLKYLKVRDFVALLPTKVSPISPVILPESNSFAILVSEEGGLELNDFIALVDRKHEGFPVRLRYLKNEELFKFLPPSASKDELTDSGRPGLVFFTESEDKRRLFLRELELMDRPKPQIQYELLVVQYQRSRSVDWSRSITATPSAPSSSSSFSGELSSLLSLNFDAVSFFGYQFALDLSLNISDGRARIFADTTLTGISGQEIRFQNTDTFRYRELEYDEDSGENKYTGVTSEVTSGLILAVNGWVSGDGMVTMTVGATISKKSGDESSDGDDPPPTTEKVVTTTVRAISGKPVVIGGLFQKNIVRSERKIPILGDIPLLGLFFRSIDRSEEDTEMVVYIVPHIVLEDESDDETIGRRMERCYESFVASFVK